jgi:hypothetical protein
MAMPTSAEKKTALVRAIEEQEAHVQSAEDLVNRQRDLVIKFTKEGLETFAEVNLLHELENNLATHKVRLGRLLYEAGPHSNRYATPSA